MSVVHASFGGCVYRAQVRYEHATALATLSTVQALEHVATGRFPNPVLISSYDYMHTSNLPQGRAQWLRRQIRDVETAIAISMDSDTWFRDAKQMAAQLRELVSRDWMSWALALAPVRQGGTDRCNLRTLGNAAGGPSVGDPLPWSEIDSWAQAGIPIGGGGFGLAVFNLRWFRNRWLDPEPERCSINTGEDIEMCLSIRRREGQIRVLPVETNHAEFTA